ncbi:MAG: serine/threonine-protein phosphatase [Clostridia bacterium]|nr:serine/threonine-protein phosphatase [Clostridia bacterium]
MQIFGMTDIGRERLVNQDDFIAKELLPGLALLCVCDGMGGVAGGKEASAIAIRTFYEAIAGKAEEYYDPEKGYFTADTEKIMSDLADAAQKANRAVFERAEHQPELQGMGTTLAAALVTRDLLCGINIGDSRVYTCSRDGDMRQLSRDHSYVQYLVDLGRISEDEARTDKNRNIITRAVGVAPGLATDVFTAVVEDSRVLICSDGLSSNAENAVIGKYLADFSLPIEATVRRLVKLANEEGGSDNITAVMAFTGEEETEK